MFPQKHRPVNAVEEHKGNVYPFMNVGFLDNLLIISMPSLAGERGPKCKSVVGGFFLNANIGDPWVAQWFGTCLRPRA